MATTSLSGLVSGFDWKAFIDSTIEYSSAPITRLEKEQTTNQSKNTALSTLDGKMTVLQSAVATLQSGTAFSARTATLSAGAPSWNASAGSATATGAYKIEVTQLATAARLKGTADIAAGLAPTSDVSGLTLSTLSVGTALTSGTFTVNGSQVTVDLADSLDDVFTAISTATGGAVTAAYDSATDKVTLSGSGPVTLGAANDTSNFLSALRLANNGTASVGSSSALGALRLASPLASAGLRIPPTGDGSFQVNGVSIAYNVATDSVKTVLQRINASAAGVSASYDSASDRVVLANKTTGDTGIFLSGDTGGLLASLGLASGATLERGANAEFTIDDGPTLISASNTLSSSSHGIDGLAVTVAAEGEATVTVAADTSAMRSAIDSFISAFNSVQTFIEEQTKITSANGKVTTSTLTDNREVQAWSQSLRRDAFTSVDGLSGVVNRLESLGIDFTSGTSQLAVKSSSTLSAALSGRPDDVAAFFTTAGTGFAARLKSSLDRIAGSDLQKGYIDEQQARLAASNTDIDKQIATIERQLEQQRALLTASFTAMESAQQGYNSMQTQLTKSFFSESK